MDLTFLSEYIAPIILVVCLVVGFIIKSITSNPQVHKFIPLIVGVLGIILYAWDTMAFTPQVIATGLVSGLASTGLYELFKQFIGNKDDEDQDIVNAKHAKDGDGLD